MVPRNAIGAGANASAVFHDVKIGFVMRPSGASYDDDGSRACKLRKENEQRSLHVVDRELVCEQHQRRAQHVPQHRERLLT